MPIVNYVREHTRFIEYASDEHLSAGERLLWYALMHIFNQRASGNVWPGEYIRISNDRLLTFCPMRYDALAAARNGLKQRGLIDYVRGEKNKTSPMYRMIYFSPEEPPESQGYTEKTDNIGGNMGGNVGGKPGGNVGDIPINLKGNQTGLCDEEEEGARGRMKNDLQTAEDTSSVSRRLTPSPRVEGTEAECVSAEEMRECWRRQFGRDPGPAVGEELARKAEILDYGGELMDFALGITARRCPDSPMDYLGEMLKSWRIAGVRTEQDAERYLYLRDAVKQGREGAAEELRAFEREKTEDVNA